MSYATIDEVAAALRVRVTPENTTLLEVCAAAATEEIDGYVDWVDAVWPGGEIPASINRCCVNRAVDWYKAADAAGGAVGFDQTGVLPAPGVGFDRHARSIRRWKQQWGVA